jgi:Rad3-related DNA helicase
MDVCPQRRRTAADGSIGEKKKEEPVVTRVAPPSSPAVSSNPWTFTDEEVLAQFPAGKAPRPQQVEAIKKINAAFRSGKKVVALEMPTGGGKSFICMAFANVAKTAGSTHFVTCQKILQKQYAKDFPSPAMEILMGRSNYACTHELAEGKNLDAAHGICRTRNKGILGDCVDHSAIPAEALSGGITPLQAAVALALPPSCHHCPYWQQLQKCSDHPITLFNFSSFLFQQRIGRFGKRGLMIVDEGHSIETNLMNFVTLELKEWALSIVGVKITRDISSKAQFAEWLRETDLVRKIADRLRTSAEDSEDVPEGLDAVQTDALRELEGKVSNFLTYLDKTEWVLETSSYIGRDDQPTKKITARPLYAKDFAEGLLFRHADRVLVMSATILDVRVWAENLGLSKNDVALVQTPCDFPVENRPIFLTYAGNCGRKYIDDTRPKLLRAVRGILGAHKGQRGMIHTQSFEFSKMIWNEIDSDRLLFQDHFQGGKEEMLEEHARRTDSIIVAPGMKEGVDLKGSLARFQIIMKVPWPSLGDKVVKERADRDSDWYAWQTALGFVQSLGRIVRSKDDWGWTYVLDQGLEMFLSRNGRLIPAWVREAFVRTLPKEIRQES